MEDRIMLELDKVSKSYGTCLALDALNLQIRRGEIFGLLGPNGAGKTTTIHLIAGLLKPDAGTITIGGSGEPSDPAVRVRLGIAPQTLSHYEFLSARENIGFFGRLYGLRGKRLSERIVEALAFVGLENQKKQMVRTFSGGMKRRLNLAIAIVHDPEIILLDEPTAGVDPQSRNAIYENILALKQAGRTLIYTTHYMEEAQRLCDHVGILDHGRLLALDTVAGLIKTHAAAPTLIVCRGDQEIRMHAPDPLAVLNDLAQKAPIDQFRLEQATLEQVFLHLTGRTLRD
jgi:ABC-2 type transport system ATP-binding protein